MDGDDILRVQWAHYSTADLERLERQANPATWDPRLLAELRAEIERRKLESGKP